MDSKIIDFLLDMNNTSRCVEDHMKLIMKFIMLNNFSNKIEVLSDKNWFLIQTDVRVGAPGFDMKVSLNYKGEYGFESLTDKNLNKYNELIDTLENQLKVREMMNETSPHKITPLTPLYTQDEKYILDILGSVNARPKCVSDPYLRDQFISIKREILIILHKMNPSPEFERKVCADLEEAYLYHSDKYTINSLLAITNKYKLRDLIDNEGIPGSGTCE